MTSYADQLYAKAEGLSPVDNTLRDLYIFISYESRVQELFNYSFKIFTRQNKTVTENNLVNDIIKLLYIIYSKSAKIALSVCVAVGKFVCDVNGGKPVRSFFV